MNSIRQRLLLGLLTGFVVLLGSGSMAVYFVTRTILVAESDAVMLTQANAIAALVKQDDGKTEYDFSEDLLAEFSLRQDGRRFEIRNSDGRLLRASHQESTEKGSTHPLLRKTPAFWDTTMARHPARSVGVLFSPRQEESEEDGVRSSTAPPVLSLILTRDQNELNHTLQRLSAVLVGVGLITLAGTVLLITATVRFGLRPLNHIGQQTMQIDASTLDLRFAVDAVPLELRSICNRLNDLLARLDKSFRREQRFSADVAHELRTPVAELRSLAEVALKWPPGETETSKAFQDARDIAQKMDGIVSGLLALVRCEEGRQSLMEEPCEVRPMVEKTWTPLLSRADRKGLKIALRVPDNLVVRSDPAAVEIILTNLFSNALEYTLVGGEIEVCARLRDSRVTITCSNSNADLTPEDMEHLCERFWRKDMARHDSAHSGLGLAICQKFADLLSAELRLEMTDATKFQASLIFSPDHGGGSVRVPGTAPESRPSLSSRRPSAAADRKTRSSRALRLRAT